MRVPVFSSSKKRGRHCERSEAIQKTPGSPRRSAAREDDPAGAETTHFHRAWHG